MKPWLTKGTLVPEVFLEIALRKRESEPRSGCDGVKFLYVSSVYPIWVVCIC